MKSLRILRHSIRQITGNLRAAVILSIPLVITLVCMWGVMPAVSVTPEESGQPGIHAGVVVLGVLSFFASLLLAVNWHRHVLLEEPVTLRPRGGRMGAYLLRGLQITILVLVVAVVVAVVVMAVNTVLGVSVALFAQDAPSLGVMFMMLIGVIAGLIIAFWIYAMMMRLSVMLPAAAVGKGIGPRQALARTRGTSGTMVMLILLTALLMIVLAIPLILAQVAQLFVLGAVLEFLLNWFMTLLGVSVLTTIYGHYVEGRPLN